MKKELAIIIKTILLLVFIWLYLLNPLNKTFNLGLIGLIVAGVTLFTDLLLTFLKKNDKHIGGLIGFLIGIIIYLIF